MQRNHYETTIILHPSLKKGEIATLVQQYKKLLKQEGSKLMYEENEGVQNLAYPIQKQTSGIYYTIQYEAPGTVTEKLKRTYRMDENIMRFLFVKLGKHGIAYHAKKREEAKKQSTQAQAPDNPTQEGK